MKRLILAIFLVCTAPFLANAQQASVNLQVGNAWVRPVEPGAKVTAAYVTISNTGSMDDILEKVVTPVAGKTEIHQTVIENNISKMVAIAKLAVPAQGSVLMQPGGIHIMLLDLRTDVQEGTAIPLTLTFRRTGTIEVNAVVTATNPTLQKTAG